MFPHGRSGVLALTSHPLDILLDYTGHIALCDFGLCKLDMKDEDRTNSESHRGPTGHGCLFYFDLIILLFDYFIPPLKPNLLTIISRHDQLSAARPNILRRSSC